MIVIILLLMPTAPLEMPAITGYIHCCVTMPTNFTGYLHDKYNLPAMK